MKTHFIGFVLVAFGFVVGFFCGLLWAARGIRNKNEDKIFEGRLPKINRVREWPDPPDGF